MKGDIDCRQFPQITFYARLQTLVELGQRLRQLHVGFEQGQSFLKYRALQLTGIYQAGAADITNILLPAMPVETP